MEVVLWPIDKPIPYARNARKIPQSAIDKVAASIKEFGFRQPIVVDPEGVIVVGHVRLLAAQKLGLTEVPVHVASNLTPAQIKTYRIMDNRSHQEAEWDFDLLIPEISELQDLSIDLSLTGFDDGEIDAFLAQAGATAEGLTAEDAAPALPEVATTIPGDLWLLGRHRVLCGDSTRVDATSRLLAGTEPLLMVTDPPYGVDYDPEWRAEAGINKNRRKMGTVDNDDRADWREAWVLFPGGVAYVWHAGRYAATVQASLEAAGFDVCCQIIWAKDRFALSRGDYHWQHEPCWYAVRRGSKHFWNGARDQSTLWPVRRADDSGHGHGTQKPAECMKRPILNNSNAGQAVYDPFLGSGTTVIAAETTGRVCLGLELDPKYVDVIVKRWQEFTGKKATLEGDGHTFEEITSERSITEDVSMVGESHQGVG